VNDPGFPSGMLRRPQRACFVGCRLVGVPGPVIGGGAGSALAALDMFGSRQLQQLARLRCWAVFAQQRASPPTSRPNNANAANAHHATQRALIDAVCSWPVLGGDAAANFKN
jgi:hypothetical protein